ncbi:MAG: DUF934 domain-containing protein [Gammaproteobacteria bacterium]
MRVIKHKQIIEDDWQVVSAEALADGIPEGDVLLPFSAWLEQQQALQQHSGKVAVYLSPDDDVEQLQPWLEQFPLIALDFPQLKDGRAYSQARLLRDRFHYKGEIRAIGDVLRDQLYYMQRCGFDAFQIREDKDLTDALNSLNDFSLTYQTAADGATPLYKSYR